MAFSQVGGARVGTSVVLSVNATWPLARLTVDEAGLSLSVLGLTWFLPRGSIRGCRKFRGSFWTGLQIEHSLPRRPGFVVFWSRDFAALNRELERCGYLVSTDR